MTEHDPVDHPSHYNSHPSGIECIQIVEYMSFNVGSAIKYLWRAGLKPEGDMIEDLMKARWYVEREIERLKEVAALTPNEALKQAARRYLETKAEAKAKNG